MIAPEAYRMLFGMASIVELAPLLADADNREFFLVNGIWNSSDETANLAHERGHTYWRPVTGGLARNELLSALTIADTAVLAPTAAASTGMRQPVDGAEAGRVLGHRILDLISAEFAALHVVLISHFLVGHDVTHRNAKPQTWGLRALEAHVRGGRNPWTILRPTWLSTIHVSWQPGVGLVVIPTHRERVSWEPVGSGNWVVRLAQATVHVDEVIALETDPRMLASQLVTGELT